METPEEGLKKLPLMSVREAIDLFAKRKEQGQVRGSVLIAAAEFIGLLEALFGFKVAAKTLKAYASPRVTCSRSRSKRTARSATSTRISSTGSGSY